LTKKFSVEAASGVASFDLPAPYVREIGRIIVRWAFFEYAVQQTVWETLDVDPAEGRIALREPRVTDRLQMINELLEYRKATWDAALYKSVLERATILAATRAVSSLLPVDPRHSRSPGDVETLERRHRLTSQGGHNPRLPETGLPRRPERVLQRALCASVSDRTGVPPAGHDMGLRLSRRRDAE